MRTPYVDLNGMVVCALSICSISTCKHPWLFCLAEASSSQRLSKLLEGKGKSKQARLSTQQQALPAAITPAMRQHATARLTQALQENSALSLEAPQAVAGASRWESKLHHGSSSKSAYLSKLANAVSLIKRAPDVAQFDFPATALELDQAMPAGQHDRSAQDEFPAAGAQSSKRSDMLRSEAQQTGSEPQTHGTSAGQRRPSQALQPVSEDELLRLMRLLSGKPGGSRHDQSSTLP